MKTNTLTKLFRDSSVKLVQNQSRPFALDKSSSPVLRVNSDIVLLRRPRFFNSLPRSSTLIKSDGNPAPCLSTSPKKVQLDSETLSSKLLGQEIFPPAPTKLFTRVEEETVEVKEIGWAGQPIVKRFHTIVPEVQGDVSDIFKASKKSKTISEVGNNLDVQVGYFGRSHDIISVINKNVQKNDNPIFSEKRGRLLHCKKQKVYCSNSHILKTNSKILKKKKRTVVLASKPAILQSLVNSKNNYTTNKSPGITPPIVLNRQLSTIPLNKYFLRVENRQFQTFSSPQYAKAAIAVKAEKISKSTKTSKKGKSSKSKSVPIVPADDCVCPEILYTKGKKKSTKICGEAATGAKAKKKSSWKQKMCLVKPKEDPGRNKTLVCLSEAAKQKKKKELPKCPKPEKKIASRVIVCEPQLVENAKKEKKGCVKVEEVKIRKTTKVCKPIIIFAKEAAGVKVEKKAVCISKKIKKVFSRHTKVCKPAKK